MYSIQFIWR